MTLPSQQKRIAVIHPVWLHVDSLHRDLIPTAYGLQELGHTATLYCPGSSVDTPDLPMRIEPDALGTTGFWRREAPDCALILTWLGAPAIVEALKAAGVCVISKADTDGLVSIRQHPIAQWKRMVLHKQGGIGKAQAAWHWAKRIAFLHEEEYRTFARSFMAADAVTVESTDAKRELTRMFAVRGIADAGDKIFVHWNPVSPVFSRGPIRVSRENLVVAVGRWTDPAKDARLLRQAFRNLLCADDGVRVEVFGPGSERCVSPAPGRLRAAGHVPHESLPAVFAAAKVIAFASRWEGMPIAALEGLASGCTVVGTPVAAFRQIERWGGGRVAAARDAAELAQALSAELLAWKEGHRHAVGIAQTWRSRVDRRAVAQEYVRLFERFG